jgi:alkyl sulfatase BDS1-like metallo-beta-lactamase superfamily hydrolase
VPGSDAEAHVIRRFPHKKVRRVRSSLRATSAPGFFRAMPLVFQRGPAKGWQATFHFELTDVGGVVHRATVRIDDGTLTVDSTSLRGVADVTVSGEAQAWLDVVSGKRNPVWLVVRRKLRLTGDRALLDRFAKCFPR